MKASILDLRRRMGDVLRSLDQNEPVTIMYRGKQRGILYPAKRGQKAGLRVSQHPAFGLWKDRADMQDVEKAVRTIRKGRTHAL
jgi:hypothetical protein